LGLKLHLGKKIAATGTLPDKTLGKGLLRQQKIDFDKGGHVGVQ